MHAELVHLARDDRTGADNRTLFHAQLHFRCGLSRRRGRELCSRISAPLQGGEKYLVAVTCVYEAPVECTVGQQASAYSLQEPLPEPGYAIRVFDASAGRPP